MHRFVGAAAAVLAVVVAGRHVHGEGQPAVQVPVSPAGHVRVGRFAGVDL